MVAQGRVTEPVRMNHHHVDDGVPECEAEEPSLSKPRWLEDVKPAADDANSACCRLVVQQYCGSCPRPHTPNTTLD